MNPTANSISESNSKNINNEEKEMEIIDNKTTQKKSNNNKAKQKDDLETEEKDYERVSSSKNTCNNDWGDWSWGCCKGFNNEKDDEAVQCSDILKIKCNKFYHFDCLKSKYNYETKDVNQIFEPNSIFHCPSCQILTENNQEYQNLANQVSALSIQSRQKTKENSPKNKNTKMVVEQDDNENEENCELIQNTDKNSQSPKLDKSEKQEILNACNELSDDDEPDKPAESSQNKDQQNSISKSKSQSPTNEQPTESQQPQAENDNTKEEETTKDSNNNNDDGDDKSNSEDDDEEEDSDYEDDSDDSMYEGLTEEQAKKLKEKQKSLKQNYQKSMNHQRELRLQEIKNGFEFECGQKISDELASFIYDFSTKQQINFMQRIENEGIFFLQSMEEMFKDKKEQALAQANNQSNNNTNNNNNNDDDEEWTGYANPSNYHDSSDYSEYDESDSDSDSDWELGGKRKRKKRNNNNNNGTTRRRRPRAKSALDEIEIDPENEEQLNAIADGKDWVKDALKRKLKHKKMREKLNTKSGYNMDGTKRCGRLLLNEALKDPNNFDGWSTARIGAFKNKEKNPNAYYYRFNDQNDPQKNGKWIDKEHKIFMERMLEIGVNDKWGVFSMKIPGRVGYQCSNYYRQLIKDKWVNDPNYFMDPKGKLHFRRKQNIPKKLNKNELKEYKDMLIRKKRYGFTVIKDPSNFFNPLPFTHPKSPPKNYFDDGQNDGDNNNDNTNNTTKDNNNVKTKENKNENDNNINDNNNNTKTKENKNENENKDDNKTKTKTKPKPKTIGSKRKAEDFLIDDDDEDDNANGSDSPPKKKRRTKRRGGRKSKSKKKDDDEDFTMNEDISNIPDEDNPLPGFMDPMTGKQLIKPAISPYGHVLGYDTWCMILRKQATKDTCPFTKQKLTRRSLTKLTKYNFDEFKDQIINLNVNQVNDDANKNDTNDNDTNNDVNDDN